MGRSDTMVGRSDETTVGRSATAADRAGAGAGALMGMFFTKAVGVSSAEAPTEVARPAERRSSAVGGALPAGGSLLAGLNAGMVSVPMVGGSVTLDPRGILFVKAVGGSIAGMVTLGGSTTLGPRAILFTTVVGGSIAAGPLRGSRPRIRATYPRVAVAMRLPAPTTDFPTADMPAPRLACFSISRSCTNSLSVREPDACFSRSVS